jgi:CheY-like chemotaxis protein
LSREEPTSGEVPVRTCRNDRLPLVLVVEDHARLRYAVVKVLEDARFEVAAAGHGAEALANLRSGARLPDVILTDLEMPTMDGYALVGALRDDPALSGIPIVAISAFPPRGGLPLDVDVLQKPCEAERLIGVLRAHLGPAADHRML